MVLRGYAAGCRAGPFVGITDAHCCGGRRRGMAMPGVVSEALSLALEINRVRPACCPAKSMDRLWEPMAKIVPFAAAWIGLADPRGRSYLTATSAGHDTAALKHLESGDFYDEVQESGLARLRGPVQLRGE